ncbi:MAG: hypothetical protein AB1641_31040 [Thermodesulfobacteriota bacterium]
MSEKKRRRIQAVCPDCGCGLIEGLTPDQWREKYGDEAKTAEVTCPECGRKHQARMIEEE